MKETMHVIIAPEPYKMKSVKHRRQRLADFLSKQDNTTVLWVYPCNIKNRFSNLENISANMYQLAITNLVPAHFFFLTPFFHKHVFKKIMRSVITLNKNSKRILWYTYPAFSDLINHHFFWKKIIYDCSDNWTGSCDILTSKRGVVASSLERFLSFFWKKSEKMVLQNSNIIFTTSEFLKRKCEYETATQVFLMENGVDFDAFINSTSGTELLTLGAPRLGYVGGFKQKIDILLLTKICHEKKNWTFIFIGPPSNDVHFKRFLENNKNVHWFKPINPSKVPTFLKQLDIGILPYREIEYNKGVFPLKFFEYLSCGIPVVGCGLPSTVKYVKEKIYVHTKADPQDFLHACISALNWSEARIERLEIAKGADWKKKFGFMLKLAVNE